MKHGLLTKFSLWRTPVPKSHQISFRFFGYHKVARIVVISIYHHPYSQILLYKIAYHFQNDFDTLPTIRKAVEQVYDGPVDYAQDFMVWNVTKEGVRTRMAVVNPEAYPPPPLKEKKMEAGGDRYQTPDSVLAGWPKEMQGVAEQIYTDFNKKHGTDFKFQLKK